MCHRLLAALLVLVALNCQAQVRPAPTAPAATATEQAPASAPASPSAPQSGTFQLAVEPQGRYWTSLEIVVSTGILIFTLVILGLLAMIMLRGRAQWSALEVTRVFGLTLVVTMSIFLVGAGYSEKQIAPVMGLLGVIAGYLLGNQGRPEASAGEAESR